MKLKKSYYKDRFKYTTLNCAKIKEHDKTQGRYYSPWIKSPQWIYKNQAS